MNVRHDIMDPIHVEEDREAVAAFYRSQPLYFDSTRRSVSIGIWLHDMEHIFEICRIEAHLQVTLASRCLVGDSRMWWVTLGEIQMPSRTWAHFRTIVLTRYGPLPARRMDEPVRDPAIYRDMRHSRYQRLSQDWHTYPGETMSHYCWRFQEMMLPYVPQDCPDPEMEALVLLRNGVPTHIRSFVPSPTRQTTVGSYIDDILEAETIAQIVRPADHASSSQAPADDAGQREPQYEVGPLFPEDPIPAVPVQEIPAQEAADPMDAEEASDDDVVEIDPPAPEDPPVIDISSDDEDDEDDDEELEPEPVQGGWDWVEDHDDLDDPEEFPLEDEPHEIMMDDGDEAADQDSDSDASVLSLEIIV